MYIKTPARELSLKKASEVARNRKEICPYCSGIRRCQTIKRHVRTCYLNPTNLKLCAVCEKPLKGFKWATVCSHSCSNKHKPFTEKRVKTSRTKKNKLPHYREVCFKAHGKQCWICGEQKIVEVHHINHKNKDNRPENLAPLCSTHHQYVHSRYKNEVIPTVIKKIEEYEKSI